MMKKLVSALALLLVAAMAFAAQFGTIHFEIPRSEQEFTVDYKVLKGMKSMKFPNQEDLYVTRAYKVKSRGTEGVMTYSLFKDTGVSDDMRDIEVMLWTRLCTLNATGLDPDKIPQLSRFKDEDVRGEFNGDCGTTNFVRGEFKNEFLRGYSYASIESFYKKGQGLVVRVAMSHDMAFFGIQPDGSFSPENTFSDFYDSFRFKDPEPHYAPAGSKDAVSLASVKVDGMKPAKAPKTKVLPVSRAFDLEKDGVKGKVTLSLFKDTGTQPGTYKEEVLTLAKRCLVEVSGVPADSIPTLHEVGGIEDTLIDCSFATMFKDYPSAFLKDNRYCNFSVVGSQGDWLLIIVFMSDDPAFFGYDPASDSFAEEDPLYIYFISHILDSFLSGLSGN